MNLPRQGLRQLLLMATALPVPALAQSFQPVSVQAVGVYVVRRAECCDVRENDVHFGWEAQLRYTFSNLSVGVGYQRSTVNAAFIEPRFVPTAWGKAAVYVAGRGGLATLRCDPGATCAPQGRELLLGGGGGILYQAGPQVSVDLGTQYFTTYFAPSQTEGARQRTGWGQVRLGLNVGF